MSPRSLVEMCIRVCIHNITMITDLGDMPYATAYPILLRVKSADQLHEIEVNCPQFQGETVELWKRLIQRDFPYWAKKNYAAKNPTSWHRVYRKYKNEAAEEIAAAEARLKEQFSAIKKEEDSNRSKIVDKSQQRFLPQIPKDSWAGSRRVPGSGNTDHLTWGGGSRTKLTDGRSFIKRAKREAREVANRRALATPTGQLVVRAGQITKAPEAMLRDYRVQAQPEIRVHIRAPKKRTEDDTQRKQNEERLLRIKNMSKPQGPQVISDSEESEDDLEPEPEYADDTGFDDGFGEENYGASAASSPPSRKAQQSSSSRKPGGLLSNSYRSTPTRTVTSPPKQAGRPLAKEQLPRTDYPVHTSPPPTSLSPPLGPQSDSSPAPSTPAGSPPLNPQKRKAPINVFMKKKKLPRH